MKQTSHRPLNRARRVALAWLAAAVVPAWAQRVDGLPELDTDLPGARLMGSGRLNFLGLHIYDIRLWVTEGFSADSYVQRPMALEIEFARSLAGHRIAERSLEEMQQLAPLTDEQRVRWLASMKQAFPDVTKGERVTGLYRPGEAARFFYNGTLRAEVADAAFARAFFAIWLSPKTSLPKLRLALLGTRA